MSNLLRDERLAALWIAVGVDGPMKGKILGQVPTRVLIKELHLYVERLEAGLETRWPPQPVYKGMNCRFEILRPPQDRGLVMP